jgi:hypothetical protein
MNWIDKYEAKIATSKRSVASLTMLNAMTALNTMTTPRTHPLTPGKPGELQTIEPSLERRIGEFISSYRFIGQGLRTCATMLVELVDLDENAFELITERAPWITCGTLHTLHRCGKHGIDPTLVIDNPTAMRRLLPCATSVVNDVVKNGLSVVRGNGHGDRIAAAVKPVDRITSADLALALKPDGTGLRTMDEQREALKEREKTSKKNRPRYTIGKDGSITFHAVATYSAAEIEDIAKRCLLQSMEGLKVKK